MGNIQIITSSPETNFAFGTGAKYLFKFNGSGEETRVSNMPMTLQYTLNNQFFLYSGFEVFTNQEEWVIEGNLLFQNYPRLYYGIGSDTKKEAEEQSQAQQEQYAAESHAGSMSFFLNAASAPNSNTMGIYGDAVGQQGVSTRGNFQKDVFGF